MVGMFNKKIKDVLKNFFIVWSVIGYLKIYVCFVYKINDLVYKFYNVKKFY